MKYNSVVITDSTNQMLAADFVDVPFENAIHDDGEVPSATEEVAVEQAGSSA